MPSEALILAGLRAAIPGCLVVAEEEVAAGAVHTASDRILAGRSARRHAGVQQRQADFAVNIGLVREGRPVLGVVGVPAAHEVFSGIVGIGAWLHKGGERTPIARALAADRGADGGGQQPSRRSGADGRVPGRTHGRAGGQLRFQPEILPVGAGRGRPVSALWPHHGVGHLRATGCAGSGRRHGRDAGRRSRCGYGKPGWDNPHFVCWGRRTGA